MTYTIKEAFRYDIHAEVRERLDFIQRYIAQGNRVGYYEGRVFQPIKLEELVSFNNAIVIGTDWENYKDITGKDLYAMNSRGGMVAALKVPVDLEQYLNYWGR